MMIWLFIGHVLIVMVKLERTQLIEIRININALKSLFLFKIGFLDQEFIYCHFIDVKGKEFDRKIINKKLLFLFVISSYFMANAQVNFHFSKSLPLKSQSLILISK